MRGSILVLFSVIFVTLIERKVLGFSQIRVGPLKLRFLGIMQPIFDGIKLLMKNFVIIININKIFYIISTFLIIFIMFMFIFRIFISRNVEIWKLFLLFLFSCLGVRIYRNFLSRWARNRKFSMLGCVRSISQTISYEVRIVFVFISLFICWIRLSNIILMNNINIIFTIIIIFILWIILVLSERNRIPFDFLEGESELVSGFNVEFIGSLFALLFIGEYGIILFFRMITRLLFIICCIVLRFRLLLLSIIWVRAVYPRFRFDKLMFLIWNKVLPIRIIFLIVFLF